MSSNRPNPSERERREMLAAVVLGFLVDAGEAGLSREQVARKAERDFDNDDQRGEVVAALDLLAENDLALVEDDRERWRATRAALAAARLSF